MAETVNIAAMATKISDEIFSIFKWDKRGPENHNWDCMKKNEHGKETHPTDVVFFYDEPYRDVRTYVQTDLKSYQTGSISRSKIEDALKSLAQQISCAEISPEYQKKYTHDYKTPEIIGMLFIYNHDSGYDREFTDVLKNIKTSEIDIPRDRRIFVLGPMEIRWLHNVSFDIQWLRGKSGSGKLPAAEACSYFYPQGDRGIRVLGTESCAAILEVLTGPWIILRYRDDQKHAFGYVVYYRDADASVDDFLYFIDYMRRSGMLNENDVSAVWAAPSGSRCEGDIRSGMGAPSHVDVRAYGYVGADPAPGAVHRGRPAAHVV